MDKQGILSGSVDFLREGGEMGQRIRDFDWENTPLGVPEQWSASLRTAVRIMLTTNHPVFIAWGPSLICFYNDAYSQSLGPEMHPYMLGRPGIEAWSEIWDAIGPQFDHVMTGQGSTWHENHLLPYTRFGKKEEVYWTYSYSPIDDPSSDSGVGGVLVLCTETTAQVLTTRRLKQAQTRWRHMFDQAPGFMCVLSGPLHVFEYATPSYFRLVGREDIIGKPILQALPWAREQDYGKLLDQVYRSGKPYTAHSAAVRITDKNYSSICYLDFVYQPIHEEDGEISGIFVLGSDVTERKLAEDALRNADRRKDEFLATLAHELRNPLAPIQTGVEVLRRSLHDPAAIAQSLDMMERQTSHLVRLVDDLMDVTRISQGKITLRREHVDLREVISSAVEACSAALYADERRLVIELPDSALPVNADYVRLVQIMSNVLTNAAKHTDSRGLIHISADSHEGSVVVRVRDDGVGVDEDTLSNMFQMFVQAPSYKEGGLGIGLALVRSLVELHGGKVEAQSEGLGKGVEITIQLPAAAESTNSLAKQQSAQSRLDGRRVLIVDDNRDAASTLGMLMELLGAQVRIANDGPSGLALLEEFSPNLVLLDIGMPGMDGYEVAERIRARQGIVQPSLVAVTGWGQEEVRQRVMQAGFDHHLVKPVDMGEIEKVMTSLETEAGWSPAVLDQ